jgi:outer membrane protein TolC
LFRIHLSVAEHRLNIDAARFSFDEREQKLTDDVRQAYYEVLESQSQHESQESALKYLQELQQLTERRFGQQTALAADALSVKAGVAKAIYQLTTIEDTLADRKEALNHLLGRSLQTDFSVESAAASLPEDQDLTTARATALEHRPEIKQAANRLSQAGLETKIEKTRYIPDISIQASYLSPTNINFLPQNIGSVGALLTWQPWDWGKKHHNVQQDVLAEKQAALSVEDTREQILLDVDSNFRRLREARAHLAVTEATRSAEIERLRNQQDAYSRQAVLLSDLLKQQASVADAEDQYRQAIFGYWKARADFQKTLGEQ